MLVGVAHCFACADDDLVIVDAEGRDPACMVLIDTAGHWDDGSSMVIFDAKGSGAASGACMCLTDDEFESQEIRWQLADRVLGECERLADEIGFDWDECQADYDNGVWLPFVYWSSEGATFDFLVPENLPCR